MHFCDRGLSSPEVGKLFMRDHTTVLAALRRKKERAVTMTFLQAVKASDRFVSLKTGRSFSMFDDGILPSPTREEILGVWAEVSG